MERGKSAAERKAKPRLVEGQMVTNWKQALGQLAIAHPDRISPYLWPPGRVTWCRRPRLSCPTSAVAR